MDGRLLKSIWEEPRPVRSALTHLIRRLKAGPYQMRLGIGAVARPHYAYCVNQAAVLAKRLGYERISVIECGVAGGRGLLALEYHATRISELTKVGIDVYGFDTGKGLPSPVDVRDLPYAYDGGAYRMDVDLLRGKLKSADLILGDIRESSVHFFEERQPAPIGAVMIDLDYYSSTIAALKMFLGPEEYWLPRAFCYFDDTVGSEAELFSEYTGERLAILDFNQSSENRKLGPAHHLLASKWVRPWHHGIWIFHLLDHSEYGTFVGEGGRQLKLRAG